MASSPCFGKVKPDHRVIRNLKLSSANRSWYKPVSPEGYTEVLDLRGCVAKCEGTGTRVKGTGKPESRVTVVCRHIGQRFLQGIKDKDG
jgi:hypothetical protein